ncbi:unnamed protein product [Rhodiola kirilowii]
MNSISQLHRYPSLLHSAHRPPFFSNPVSSFPRIPPQSPSFKLLCIKASTFSPPIRKTLIPSSSSIIRNSCIALTAAALLLVNLTHRVLPAVACPAPPPMVESEAAEQVSYNEEKEKNLEADVAANPDDVKALQSLMECKVRGQKIEEALVLLERLISIEPDNTEWSLLRANLLSLSGESELAKAAFEDVLKKDPLCVEAYHGIVMALSQSSSDGSEELKEMLDRIEVAMEKCGKDDEKKEDLRDFKLLLAQIKVFEGNYGDALKVYQDLSVEEPKDFRPFLCQGIVYTLLRREDEAKIQFEKYKRLVPEGHPYDQYLEANMFQSMGTSQGVDSNSTSVENGQQ